MIYGCFPTMNGLKLIKLDYVKQDSKALSPRSLVNALTSQFSKCSKFSRLSKFWKFSKFKPCQMMILKYSYDTIWCNRINSCHSKNSKTCLDMSRHVRTCLEVIQVNFCQKLFWMSETISVHNMFSPGLSLEFSCIELVIQWTICCHIVG